MPVTFSPIERLNLWRERHVGDDDVLSGEEQYELDDLRYRALRNTKFEHLPDELLKLTASPLGPPRIFYFSKAMHDREMFESVEEAAAYGCMARDEERWISNMDDANLVASKTTDGKHAPVIDLDFPCRLIRSRSDGNYHLYLDRETTWWRFRLVLWAMKVAGFVQPGYYRASVRRGMTFVRWNWRTHLPLDKAENPETRKTLEAMKLLEELRGQGQLEEEGTPSGGPQPTVVGANAAHA